MGKRKLGLVMIVLLAMTLVGLLTSDQLILRDAKILPNVQIANINIGGLFPEEAEQKLRESTLSASKAPIMVTDQNRVWFIQPSEIDFSIDLKRSVAAAYSVGREDDFFQRWKQRLLRSNQPLLLPVAVEVNRTKLARSLSALGAQTDRLPKDASLMVQIKTKSVSLSPAVEGRKLNVDKTVSEAFSSSQNQLPFVISLVFDIKSPEITDEQYSGINTMLASYSTNFNPWDDERNSNLRLAARRIHGTILKPGETFSYNKNVGHRTKQEGFRMANVILDGKLVPDWGGGVCQVSSTLYNAVLLADLDIIDRSNHGRAIGYVPLGFDATVVDGLIDFKFRNSLKRSVVVHTHISDNELIFSILGDAKDAPPPIELDYVVHKVIEPIEIKQPDPTLEVGKEVVEEPPQRGFRVSTYRIRTINGKQVSQLLATDDYDPVNRIIKVGTKPKEGEAQPPVSPPKTVDKKQPTRSQSPSGATTTLQGQPSRTTTPTGSSTNR